MASRPTKKYTMTRCFWSLVPTSVNCQLSKPDTDFWWWHQQVSKPDLYLAPSLEASIWWVLCCEKTIRNWFHPFLTWLESVVARPEHWTTSILGCYQIGIFVVIACTWSVLLGTVSQALSIYFSLLLVWQASHAWRVAQVSWRLFFVVAARNVFFACFVVDLMFVARDQGHEFAQFVWGFLFRGPPGSWLCLPCLRHSGWRTSNNNPCCRMIFVMLLTTPSQRPCWVCWQGRLVASKLITTASLVAF